MPLVGSRGWFWFGFFWVSWFVGGFLVRPVQQQMSHTHQAVPLNSHSHFTQSGNSTLLTYQTHLIHLISLSIYISPQSSPARGDFELFCAEHNRRAGNPIIWFSCWREEERERERENPIFLLLQQISCRPALGFEFPVSNTPQGQQKPLKHSLEGMAGTWLWHCWLSAQEKIPTISTKHPSWSSPAEIKCHLSNE